MGTVQPLDELFEATPRVSSGFSANLCGAEAPLLTAPGIMEGPGARAGSQGPEAAPPPGGTGPHRLLAA